jgi:hypothetical protein
MKHSFLLIMVAVAICYERLSWVGDCRRFIEFERQLSRKRTPKRLCQETIFGQERTSKDSIKLTVTLILSGAINPFCHTFFAPIVSQPGNHTANKTVLGGS